MKFLHNAVQPQGMSIDGMSDQYREDDDLDSNLRDALRSDEAEALKPERVFAALRVRLPGEHVAEHAPWSLAAPGWTSLYMSASYWYLVPLTRNIK
jgi:hypothetical protein